MSTRTSTLVAIVLLASVLVPAPATAQGTTHFGVTFPEGDRSFADIGEWQVFPQGSGNQMTDPTRAEGPPDCASDNPDPCFASLGVEANSGLLEVTFVDNALTADGTAEDDVYFFEAGSAVGGVAEEFSAEISVDGTEWISIGEVSGGEGTGIDIDPFADQAAQYRHVRMASTSSRTGGGTPGPDIDAVGAISSVAVDPGEDDPPPAEEPAPVTQPPAAQIADVTALPSAVRLPSDYVTPGGVRYRTLRLTSDTYRTVAVTSANSCVQPGDTVFEISQWDSGTAQGTGQAIVRVQPDCAAVAQDATFQLRRTDIGAEQLIACAGEDNCLTLSRLARRLIQIDGQDRPTSSTLAARLLLDVLTDPTNRAHATWRQQSERLVYAVTDREFADALAVSGVTGATQGVMVELDPDDQQGNDQALGQLDPDRVVIVGGPAAVPEDAFTIPVSRDRIGGVNRFDTAAQVSRSTYEPGVDKVYVATGRNFPDALSGGAQASLEQAPVLLVDGSRMPDETAAELTRLDPDQIQVLGGTAVVPESIVEEMRAFAPSVIRVAGGSRVDTALEVSKAGYPDGADVVYMASGDGFNNALAASANAWVLGGPLLLVGDTTLPDATADEVMRLDPGPGGAAVRRLRAGVRRSHGRGQPGRRAGMKPRLAEALRVSSTSSRTLLAALGLLLLAALLAPPVSAQTVSRGDVLVNEVQTGSADGWAQVEIIRAGDGDVDLTGVFLAWGTSTVEFSASRELSGTLTATIVVCYPTISPPTAAAPSTCDEVSDDTGFDAATHVTLDLADGTTIDRVGWGGDPFGEGDTSGIGDPGQDRSLSRCAHRTDTDDNAADFRGTTPTPRMTNHCPRLLVSEVDYAGGAAVELFNVAPDTVVADLSDYELVTGADDGGQVITDLTGTLPIQEWAQFTVEAFPSGPNGVAIRSRFTPQVLDAVTWGGGGAMSSFTEGTDAHLVDPDELGLDGDFSLSRCPGPNDSDDNATDFFGTRLSLGGVNRTCPSLELNEIEVDGPNPFVELINDGREPLDLDLQAISAGGATPTLMAGALNPGELHTLCVDASATGCDAALGFTFSGDPGAFTFLGREGERILSTTTWDTADPDLGDGESRNRCLSNEFAPEFVLRPTSRGESNRCRPVVINEIRHLDGDGGASGDFVELLNVSARPVDLTGLTLEVDGTPVPQSGMVAAGGHRIADLGGQPLGAAGSLRLVAEFLPAPADQVAWGAATTPLEGAPISPTQRDADQPVALSMIRCPDGTDTGHNDTDFQLYGDPSPGAANDCFPTTPPPSTTPVLTVSTGSLAGGGGAATGTVSGSDVVNACTWGIVPCASVHPDYYDPPSGDSGAPISPDSPFHPDSPYHPDRRRPVEEVLIASDSVFPDALASGVLQRESVLLYSDRDTLSPELLMLIRVLAPERVRILGGTVAISDTVADAFVDAGFEVVRTAGPTRLETAAEIAAVADASDTAIISRAFPSAGGDDTQAFADSLAAGGMAASTGWPVLLSQTSRLSDTTRQALIDGGFSDVVLVGGTAALSAAVADEIAGMGIEVTRVSGATRFATAVAIAEARGFSADEPAQQVILIEGQAAYAWGPGFASPILARLWNAPVLLVNGDRLPPATVEALQTLVAPDADALPSLYCSAITEAACTAATELLGLES